MATPELILSIAKRHHKAKRYTEAEKLYRQLLENNPANLDAGYRLGLLAIDMGNPEKAVELLGEIGTANPDQPEILLALGMAYMKIGHLDEAFTCISRATFLAPENPRMLLNFGELMLQKKQYESALQYFKVATELSPKWAEAHLKLGVAHAQLDKYKEAANHFKAVTQLDPDNWEGFSYLGLALYAMGQLEQSKENQEIALLLNPGNPELLRRLSTVLSESGESTYALSLLKELEAMVPKSPAIQCKQAEILYKDGELNDSITCCTKALAINQNYAAAHLLLGKIFRQLGDMEKAASSFESALAHNPQDEEAFRQLAHLQLLQGKYALGKQLMDEYISLIPNRFDAPIWDGTPIKDKTLFIYSVQNNLEIPVFTRFIKPLKQQGATIVVEASSFLAPALETVDGIDHVWTGDSTLMFDAHLPIERLIPLTNNGSEANSHLTNLHTPADRIEHWSPVIPQTNLLNVGIMWRHEQDFAPNAYRSIPLEALTPIFNMDGFQFINLQYQSGQEELKKLGTGSPFVALDQTPEHLLDKIGLLQNLDLFITADTVLAQLAVDGGIPTWVLASTAPSWYWGLCGDTSPWFPNARVFRQTEPGGWDFVIKQLIDELKGLGKHQ